MQPTKRSFLSALALALVISAVVIGCASLNRNTYNAENLSVDLVTAAGHGFNVYFHGATNGATPDKIASLEATRTQVYAAITDFHATVSVVDHLRLAYATNSAATNETALAAGITTLGQQSTNIINLITTLSGK